MMGRQDAQQPLYCVVDLEQRVPPGHPLRKINAAVDFTFARAEVAPFYGYNGQVSVDPVVILKLLFLLFLDDVPGERELMRQVAYRLDYLWFLGLGLNDAVPDHSVLSKARARWGPAVFERLFVRTVRQCVEAGLVDGSKVHVDASVVDADASKNSVAKGSPRMVARRSRRCTPSRRPSSKRSARIVGGARAARAAAAAAAARTRRATRRRSRTGPTRIASGPTGWSRRPPPSRSRPRPSARMA